MTPPKYITEVLKGGAVIKWGSLPIGETEEGVVIEPEVETQVADKADQMAGAAGVYVIKAGFQIRATMKRFSAETYAAALGLAADTSATPARVNFTWPSYLEPAVLEVAGTRADGVPCVWHFPAAAVLPSGSVTLSREPSGVPIVWKALVDPTDVESFGYCEIGETPSA